MAYCSNIIIVRNAHTAVILGAYRLVCGFELARLSWSNILGFLNKEIDKEHKIIFIQGNYTYHNTKSCCIIHVLFLLYNFQLSEISKCIVDWWLNDEYDVQLLWSRIKDIKCLSSFAFMHAYPINLTDMKQFTFHLGGGNSYQCIFHTKWS